MDGTEQLPVAYVLLLWLRELGLAAAQIAAALDVAPESIAHLTRLAEAKRSRTAGSVGTAPERTTLQLFATPPASPEDEQRLVTLVRQLLALDVEIAVQVANGRSS